MKRLIYVFALFLIGGCDLDFGGNDGDPDEVPGADTVAEDAAEPPDASPELQYYYVRIDDLEESGTNSFGTSGAEIDGVALLHGGTANYADHVDEINFGAGETNFTDASQVLGAPEGGENGLIDTQNPHFVSLGGMGGTGGYVVVSFWSESEGGLQEIHVGDTIRVYECGDLPELYQVSIGTGPSAENAQWVPCGSSMSGVAECTVSGL